MSQIGQENRPVADGVIFRGGQNVSFKGARVPRETIAFSFQSNQDEIGRAKRIWLGHRGVLGAIKDVNRPHNSAGGDHIGVLGHISRSIDFAIVGDLLGHGQLAFCVSVAALFLSGIDRSLSSGVNVIVWHLDLRDLQVVLLTV